jgi:PPIC-type PPIASE domain
MTIFGTFSIAGFALATLSVANAWAQAGTTEATLSSPTAQVSVAAEPDRTKASASAIAPSEPVITIHNPCGKDPVPLMTAANSCTTVVTREAFEHLLESMNITGKPLTPEFKRNLAETYAQYLALEPQATKAGLQDTQRFAEIMQWWRLRTLAGLYRSSLQEQFKDPSTAEIHSYYIQHIQSYQRINVARILIPRTLGTTDEAKSADEKALRAANSARERAAKGEDPELVQKDVYAALEQSSPPITTLGTLARSGFPPDETDELFSLDSDKVSKVESEGASYVVYKILSKETLPEDGVKDEISRQIAQDKFDKAMQSLNESAKPELNQAYFGAKPPAATVGAWTNSHP